MKPLFTIITPVLNGAQTIENTIKSIINQSFVNNEYIVVDGGSADDTVQICEKYIERIVLVQLKKNKGIYGNMNEGIKRAKGDWLLFLGADDYLFSNEVLSFFAHASKGLRNKFLLLGNTSIGGKIKPNFLSAKTLLGNTCNHQGVFYHKSIFQTYRYDETYIVGADYKLNLTLFLKNTNCYYINKTISFYSVSGISSTKKDLAKKEEIRVRNELIWRPLACFLNGVKLIKWRLEQYFKK